MMKISLKGSKSYKRTYFSVILLLLTVMLLFSMFFYNRFITERGDGLTAPEFLKKVKEKYPNIIIMADCATLEEAISAHKAGADLVGSTMNGYTAATAHCKGEPNYELIKQMVAALPCPVIAEGRVHTPEQAKKMLEIGAWAVVVGGAITRPLEIANRFMAAIKDQ